MFGNVCVVKKLFDILDFCLMLAFLSHTEDDRNIRYFETKYLTISFKFLIIKDLFCVYFVSYVR